MVSLNAYGYRSYVIDDVDDIISRRPLLTVQVDMVLTDEDAKADDGLQGDEEEKENSFGGSSWCLTWDAPNHFTKLFSVKRNESFSENNECVKIDEKIKSNQRSWYENDGNTIAE